MWPGLPSFHPQHPFRALDTTGYEAVCDPFDSSDSDFSSENTSEDPQGNGVLVDWDSCLRTEDEIKLLKHRADIMNQPFLVLSYSMSISIGLAGNWIACRYYWTVV